MRARLLFAVALLVQVVVLYWPRPVGTGGVPGLDKAVHVGVFAAAAASGHRAGVPAGWLAAGLGLHAALSEVVQGRWLAGRSGDPADALADLVGVALGIALAIAWGVAPARRSAR